MDVVAMYDYYFLTDTHRKFDDRCEFGVCENSVVYRRMKCALEECAEKDGRSLCRPNVAGSSNDVTSGNDLRDVLEYMLYNVSGDTGLPAHYSCCMYFYRLDEEVENEDRRTGQRFVECGHACNAIPIMIGSRLEMKILHRLAEMLGIRASDIYDSDYLHDVYAGSYLVNGTFYYSVFRESNNNKMCHNSKSKYRGEETVAYFYDNTCNRGVKLFTNCKGQLRINDRDGVEVTDVTSDVMLQLYKECVKNYRHYTLDMSLIKGFFSAVKEQGLVGIDDFKNKIYTNYSIGLNTFLDKFPAEAMRNPMWNSSLMVGKINFGISQRLSYPKSKSETKKLNEQKLKMCTGGMSTGYLVETQRRRNTRKTTNAPSKADGQLALKPNYGGGIVESELRKRRQTDESVVDGSERAKRGRIADERVERSTVSIGDVRLSNGHTILGSKEIKTVGLMEKLEQGERNGPSTFNQVSVSYLPLIRVLSNTVQKLQVEHVHAESSKTVPRDAYGFVCMKYMGNISTAGKNMLFTERVEVSYGHVHGVVGLVEQGIESLTKESEANYRMHDPLIIFRPCGSSDDDENDWMYVVINNAVTSWKVRRGRLVEFLVFLKVRCHRYSWTKVVGRYLCVCYYEGVPLLRYERDERMFLTLVDMIGDERAQSLEGVESLLFSRDELDMLAAMHTEATAPHIISSKNELIERTNKLIDEWFMLRREDGGYESVDHSSLLAKHLDQYTEYTAPAKRSVSVNARKSACINVYYQRAAELIRGFNIFVDPEGYERATARRVAYEHKIPEWVTLNDFRRTRAEYENCPQPQDSADRSIANFYMLRTVFADVDGYNVEDANVLDASVDLNLSYSYSFSLTFVDRTKYGLDIVIPPAKSATSVCCWDAEGNPTTVMFMVCTIRRMGGEECSDTEVADMLRLSPNVRMLNRSGGSSTNNVVVGGGGGHKRQASKLGHDPLNFPPFRKLSVVRSEDGNYHVYFMRNDAVLIRSVRRLRQDSPTFSRDRTRPDSSNAMRLANDDYVFVCKPEVNPYDALVSMKTDVTSFEVNAGERVVTIDVRVSGTSDKYDGLKIVNSFGQKGLAVIKDLHPYFGQCTATAGNVPVQLVMNNCSFVSRQPVGQYLQMKKNMFAVASSAAGEPTSVGYSAVFFTETEPVTKSCLVRFDEMMRSVIITLGLTAFQNLKNSLDNVYNPYGLLYPPQTRQILDLYRCVGVSYKFTGNESIPFASRDDVRLLYEIYDAYNQTPKPTKANSARALLDLLDTMKDGEKTKRLMDIGILSKYDRPSATDSNIGGASYALHLQGQRIMGFENVVDANPVVRRAGDSDVVSQRPNFVIRSYDSESRTFKTIRIYGEPNFVADALDDRRAK